MGDEPSETEHWYRQRVLGSGGFGVVTLWVNKSDGKMIAIKKCRWGTDSVLTPKHKERWTNEVDIMQRLQHRGVVQALKVPIELENALRGELPLLCMEFCSKGDLRQILNRPESCCGLKESQVSLILKDVSNAVEYLHSNKITHRDLKPENIVMQDDINTNNVIYKLIDLGYAKELDQSSMCASFVGTLQYLAPELFLSKKYSCTVDYWSLGLVAHEIITGIRPFLPNMPPAAWMTHVKKKTHEDICAYEDIDGTIKFSHRLYPQNHISECLQDSLEKWLRLALDWDPKRRGRQNLDSELLIFSMIKIILNKKIVPVYCIATNQIWSYIVDEYTQLKTLQDQIARDTDIAVKDQELLLTKGIEPNPQISASQCCPPQNDNGDWYLLVFKRGEFSLPKVKPNVPPLVGEMMIDAKSPVAYAHQKKAWAHAVFFLQQEANLYCNFLRAHRAKIIYSLSKARDIGRKVTQLLQGKSKLTILFEFYKKSLKFDDKKAHSSKDSLIQDISVVWRTELESFSIRLNELLRLSGKLEAEGEKIGIEILNLKKSPFANLPRLHSKLDDLTIAGQQQYESLKRRSKDDRLIPQCHGDMAKIIYHCLKHRDKLYHDQPFSQHLNEIEVCQRSANNIIKEFDKLLNKFDSFYEELTDSQLERQSEIWTVLGTELKKSKKSVDEVAPPIPKRDSSIQLKSSGAIPKQPIDMKLVETIEMTSSPAFLTSVVTEPNRNTSEQAFHSLPATVPTEDIIRDNENLRYMTQELFNKGFAVYKDYINSIEPGEEKE